MGALSRIRVIDFGQYIAGPMTGMFLADHGADVIRVDPPGGPRWDTPGNATWNRGKRSIILDLKSEPDLNVARRLVETADVLIENFRPGVMERLGLGPSWARTANPKLVYCSMPGFANDDPRRDIPGWEGVIGAATATYRPNPQTGRPVYSAIPIASSFAAFQAATSIVMALIARDRDGVGQTVEVPLFDGMFAAIGSARLHDRPTPPGPGAASPWTRQFQCSDGRWIQFHAISKGFSAFVQAVNAEDWAFAPNNDARIAELFRTRSSHEWEDFATRLGTECVVCLTSEEWLRSSQARASILAEVNDHRLGKMTQPGVCVILSETPGAIRGPAPSLDEHRAELMREVAAAPKPASSVDEGEPGRHVLDGIRVLDLSMFLAGPSCGRTLAEFGADVIKIDSPHRDEALVFHLAANRGKRSIRLDLKSEDGIDLFWRLVDTADVVVQNFRKGVVERLGIGYEQVRAKRPDIVYIAMNTYGQVGPWADRPGHEQLAQAATGMQARQGGDGRPAMQPFAVTDYGTGLMGAFGVALALFERNRSGRGQHVDTALAYTGSVLQSPFLQDYEGKVWDEPRGNDLVGSAPFNRAYQAADGWFFISLSKRELPKLERIPELAGIRQLDGLEFEAALEALAVHKPVADWVRALNDAGVGAHAVVGDAQELMRDTWVQDHGLSITREHLGFGLVTTTGPAPRLSRTPVTPGSPASPFGGDTDAVLSELRVSASREVAQQRD